MNSIYTDNHGIVGYIGKSVFDFALEEWSRHYFLTNGVTCDNVTLYNPIPDGYQTYLLDSCDGSISLLNDFKVQHKITTNTACRNQIIGGFESNALGKPHQYPFKEEDQSNLMSTFILAKELGVDKPFKCRDGTGEWDYRMHTVAELQQVGEDAEVHKMVALMKANGLKTQIEAATTAEEVQAITW